MEIRAEELRRGHQVADPIGVRQISEVKRKADGDAYEISFTDGTGARYPRSQTVRILRGP